LDFINVVQIVGKFGRNEFADLNSTQLRTVKLDLLEFVEEHFQGRPGDILIYWQQ
jgi:hypothetical protein